MPNEITTRNDMILDRQKINELAQYYAEFLPGSKTLPEETRVAMAQLALMHRLDPFLGDTWPIPERQNIDGRWQTSGYKIMIGITAYRRCAHETNEYWGRRFEKCTDEERQWLGAGTNDLTIKCIVMRRKTGQQPMEFDGFGIFKQGEKSKMNPLQCVRLRAERDALKGAFPISLGGGAVKIGVADDTGEEINGDTRWDVITTEPAEPPIEQHDTLDELTEAAGRDAVTNAPAQPRQSYRMAKVKFNGMSVDTWHTLCAAFAKENANWQKDGKPDMNHILTSACHAGYEYITSDNVSSVFAAIVAAHEAKP